MADDQYRWLDRATAERLLSGEPPEAVDPAARDQARRLAGTLRALSAPPPADGEELPGEAAALATFRKVREEEEGREETAPDTAGPAGTRPSDVGLFRLDIPRGDRSGTPDGPRRPRPLRLGLAAALVVGMVGGAAVLAGTGVLSGPSGGSGTDPAASASGTHREQPPISSPPKGGAPGGPTPEGEHPDGAAGTAESGTDADGSGAPGENDRDTGENAARSGRGWKQLAASCRAWRDGERLNGERRHLLENAAGGSSHVGTYCEGVLSTTDPSGGSGTSGTSGTSDASGAEEGTHPGNGNGNGNGGGNANGQGNGNGNGKNKGQKGQGQSNGSDQGNGGNSPKKSDYDDSEDEDDDQGGQGDNGNGNGGDNGNGNDNNQ